MANIRINDAAMLAVESIGVITGDRGDDGLFPCDINDRAFACLESMRFPRESMSDVVLQFVACQTGALRFH